MNSVDIATLPHPYDRLGECDSSVMVLAKGLNVFNQNDLSTGLFFLCSGAVVLRRSTARGDSAVLHRAEAGDTFAEASLFSEVYHCTATTCRESEIIQFKKEALLAIFDTDADFARAIAARFAQQVQSGRRKSELLTIRNANERIMAALSDGMLKDDISVFADSIGLAHATVYRGLSQLADDGKILKTDHGAYLLK